MENQLKNLRRHLNGFVFCNCTLTGISFMKFHLKCNKTKSVQIGARNGWLTTDPIWRDTHQFWYDKNVLLRRENVIRRFDKNACTMYVSSAHKTQRRALGVNQVSVSPFKIPIETSVLWKTILSYFFRIDVIFPCRSYFPFPFTLSE